MTANEVRKLKVGDRVRLACGENHYDGSVQDVGYTGAIVKWDDGQVGSLNVHGVGKNFTAKIK